MCHTRRSFDSTSSSLSSLSSSSSSPRPLHAPVGLLVDPIFTPPLPSWPLSSLSSWSRRPLSSSHLHHSYKWLVVVCRFARLFVVVVVVKQKQRRKHNWLIVVQSPPPPLTCCCNALLPQHRSVLQVIDPSNPGKKRIGLLGGSSSINPTQRHGTKGLMWGARGQFLPAAAMVMMMFVLGRWFTSAHIYFGIVSTYFLQNKNVLGLNYLDSLCKI